MIDLFDDKVVSVDYDRDQGFLDGMGIDLGRRAPRTATRRRPAPTAGGDYEIVGNEASQGAEDGGRTAEETLLSKNPDINVVYTINEPAAYGAYEAFKAAGKRTDDAHRRLGRRRLRRRRRGQGRHHRRDQPAVPGQDGRARRAGDLDLVEDRHGAREHRGPRLLQHRRRARDRRARRTASSRSTPPRPPRSAGADAQHHPVEAVRAGRRMPDRAGASVDTDPIAPSHHQTSENQRESAHDRAAHRGARPGRGVPRPHARRSAASATSCTATRRSARPSCWCSPSSSSGCINDRFLAPGEPVAHHAAGRRGRHPRHRPDAHHPHRGHRPLGRRRDGPRARWSSRRRPCRPGCRPSLGLFLGLVVGLAAGALNGFLVTRLKLPPFIVTLGTLNIFVALTLLYSGGADRARRPRCPSCSPGRARRSTDRRRELHRRRAS